MSRLLDSLQHITPIAKILAALPSGRRAAAFREALIFSPATTLDLAFNIGPLRAEFANCWETESGDPVPIGCLRQIFEPPIRIDAVLLLGQLSACRDVNEVAASVVSIIDYLRRECEPLRHRQSQLFSTDSVQPEKTDLDPARPEIVESLTELIDTGIQFPTIYADPPWQYSNKASNGAVANHYPTMTVDEICNEPVGKIAQNNAHLHLWTTNPFLREAFQVLDAWGFTYKSCMVWVKPEIGMGNYWRVSHEYLMLGVRGRLTFQDRTLRSWLESSRTIHSRKPAIVRSLIERASPGPYLELYGRTELPESQWTVYGNQVEKKWF